MDDSWRFDDPPNVAVFTTRAVVQGGQPILLVTHDEEDGAWQFHSGAEASVEEALVVSLRTIAKLDPSIEELADLPYGWIARRANATSPWTRSPRSRDAVPAELT